VDVVDRVGAVAVAALVALGAVAGWQLADGQEAPSSTSVDPVEELVEAWARTRRSTYHATGTFERRGRDGAQLSVPVEIAQRPPDRLLRQFGEVTGRRDDRPLQCPAPVGDAELDCRLGPPGGSFAEVVADEVEAFRALVSGADPLYDVGRAAGDGCWRMTRTRPDPRGGFGVEAVVCVDAKTGALRSVSIDHGSVDERTTYDEIDPEVTDQHLEP
jgi:hypothetical protein